MNISKLLNIAIDAAIEAGKEVIKVYESELIYSDLKDDNSPVTKADLNSHESISKHLKNTNIPVLSEEGVEVPYEVRKNWKLFWMIDPLDGTKEFLRRNGEFSINIALIKNQKPIIGVVYAPAKKTLYFAEKSIGSFKATDLLNYNQILKSCVQLPIISGVKNTFRIVTSRSHLDKKTESHIDILKSKMNKINIIKMGSSLKICLLAEGKADYYPRFQPLMEWDIAAAWPILVYSKINSKITYNKFNCKKLLIDEVEFKII